MKKHFKYTLCLILLSGLLFSCSKSNDKLVIGTFNIKWLGDGKNDRLERSDADYDRISTLIGEIDADILALQEIENKAALSRLSSKLDNYQFKIVNDDYPQKTAYLVKNEIDIVNTGCYFPIEVIPGDTRPGFYLAVKYKNEKIHLMNLHFKSTSRYDSTDRLRRESIRIRTRQAEKAAHFADSLISAGEENVVISGDLNDNPFKTNRETLSSLKNNNNLIFLTDGLPSCRNRLWHTIDHIVVSKPLFGNYLKGSSRVVNFNNSVHDRFTEKISDHCPVLANFIFD